MLEHLAGYTETDVAVVAGGFVSRSPFGERSDCVDAYVVGRRMLEASHEDRWKSCLVIAQGRRVTCVEPMASPGPRV